MKLSFITNLIKNRILSTLNSLINNIYIKNLTDIYIDVDPTNLEKALILLSLQTNFRIKTLNEFTVVDFPFNIKNRFQCVYILSSWKFSNRLIIQVPYIEAKINKSITNIFTCAEWYEREVWDLYGLWFENHPNLRRILNDYGYRDYPFRKDYPLNGYIQVQYNSILNSVIIHKLTSLQEFRVWDFQSPWISETTYKQKYSTTDTFNLDMLDKINVQDKVLEESEKEAIIQYLNSIQEINNIYEEDIWELTTFTS